MLFDNEFVNKSKTENRMHLSLYNKFELRSHCIVDSEDREKG